MNPKTSTSLKSSDSSVRSFTALLRSRQDSRPASSESTHSARPLSRASPFSQHLDAGSQVATITNTQTITPNFNVAEVFGFIREKLYSTVAQPAGFTPSELGINAFGSTT